MEDVGLIVPRRTACLSCGAEGLVDVLSLGLMPLANAYRQPGAATDEVRFPLEVACCPGCSLVQLRHVVPPEAMFSDYLYFSSYSASMLAHAERLANTLVTERRLGSRSLVMEVASNDGYLLQYFRRAGVPVLGIEPAANVAAVAREAHQIPTLVEYFGRETGRRLAEGGQRADVLLGLNVMAPVPDINSFLGGVAAVLAPGGVAVIEAPYVRDMVEKTEFDTIYHEHIFYFSVTAVARAVERHGLVLERVDRVPVHGGSLRLSIVRGATHGPSAQALLDEEARLGLDRPEYYAGFRRAVEQIRADMIETVERLRRGGASIGGYGAAAKATILLNYCGLSSPAIAFVADRSPHKQGRLMPGCGIPIVGPEAIRARQPEYVVLFVWNIKDEVLRQEAAYRDAGGRFIVAVPQVRIE
jgi:SAM-dependent methyltransferase